MACKAASASAPPGVRSSPRMRRVRWSGACRARWPRLGSPIRWCRSSRSPARSSAGCATGGSPTPPNSSRSRRELDMKISEADFEFVRKLVREQSGIVISEDKRYLVETRLAPLAEKLGYADLATLVVQLRGQTAGNLHRQVVEMMTTNETYFFRDNLPFDALHQLALPTLAQRRDKRLQLTILRAAC